MLKVFLLRRIGFNTPTAEVEYDETHQMVIIADSEERARRMAESKSNDEFCERYLYVMDEGAIWSDPNKVECIDLSSIHEPTVVCVSQRGS